MQNKKHLSMLGLARRAGKLSMGHDTALDSVKKQKAKLILFCSDASERLVEEFERASERFCPLLTCLKIEETMDEVNFALGYRAGVITVNDNNFANRIIELINQEGNAYGSEN